MYPKEFGNKELNKYIPIDVDKKDFDNVCPSEWFMPQEYKEPHVEEKIINKCENEEQVKRAYEELEEFSKEVCMTYYVI